MKEQDPKNQKKRRFIKTPTYPGGKKAFIEFIHQHLQYPREALEKGIEGVVFAEYYVDNLGQVGDIYIKHGIGYGCDEEAERLIRLLVYEPVRNRGIKMKALMKARIAFKLPGVQDQQMNQPADSHINLKYSIVSSENTEKPKKDEPSSGSGYTIILGKG